MEAIKIIPVKRIKGKETDLLLLIMVFPSPITSYIFAKVEVIHLLLCLKNSSKVSGQAVYAIDAEE